MRVSVEIVGRRRAREASSPAVADDDAGRSAEGGDASGERSRPEALDLLARAMASALPWATSLLLAVLGPGGVGNLPLPVGGVLLCAACVVLNEPPAPAGCCGSLPSGPGNR